MAEDGNIKLYTRNNTWQKNNEERFFEIVWTSRRVYLMFRLLEWMTLFYRGNRGSRIDFWWCKNG